MATSSTNTAQAANLGFEAKLFLAADKLRGSMDASEYKHVALGLVFLKYISDGAVRRMRTRIRLLVQPESMHSIIGATQ